MKSHPKEAVGSAIEPFPLKECTTDSSAILAEQRQVDKPLDRSIVVRMNKEGNLIAVL